MAFSTTITTSSVAQPKPTAKPADGSVAAPMLAAVLLAALAAGKSKKSMTRFKRQMALLVVKQSLQQRWAQFKNIFSKKGAAEISNRTLIYILIGAIVLALIFVNPVLALVVLLIAVLVLLLAGRI